MASIGETLRRERLKRNLELGSIADELRISARFLAAIEDEQFDKLPGGIFSKSFVRQYASFLGLDAEGLTAEFQRAVEPREQVPQFAEKPKPDVPELRIDGYRAWQGVGERRRSWPSWVMAAVIVVAVMLVCSGVVWWWERPRRQVQAREIPRDTPAVAATKPAPPVAEPAGNPPATAAPTVDSGAAASQPPAQNPAPQTAAAVPPPPAPTVAAAQSNPNASVRVAITADQAVWIRASANGKYVFSGTLQPHEIRNVDADGAVEVLLGNAGGATITLNGRPISVEGLPAGTAGPKGQVRTVQFTSGGFQIVPPKSPDRDLR